MTKDNLSLTTKDIVLMSLMLSIIEAAKFALSFVPGVEVVSLLFIVYTLFFGKKMIYMLPAFCLLEGVLYGFGLWWFIYLYIWAFLVIVTFIFRRKKSVFFWSTVSGLYGLFFGLLCSPVYLVTGGINMALSWWIAGIFVDIAHGISNFIVCLVLFKPLCRVLRLK